MKHLIKLLSGIVVVLVLFSSGCSAAKKSEWSASNLTGVNHTQKGITSFSANGYGGQIGGNTCCIMLPDKWRPGLKVTVEWTADPNPNERIKRKTEGFGFDEEALAKHEANYEHHRAVVEIPEYADVCPLTVHFLPCSQVKVVVECAVYGLSPNSSIKEPRHMPEPAVCSK